MDGFELIGKCVCYNREPKEFAHLAFGRLLSKSSTQLNCCK